MHRDCQGRRKSFGPPGDCRRNSARSWPRRLRRNSQSTRPRSRSVSAAFRFRMMLGVPPSCLVLCSTCWNCENFRWPRSRGFTWARSFPYALSAGAARSMSGRKSLLTHQLSSRTMRNRSSNMPPTTSRNIASTAGFGSASSALLSSSAAILPQASELPPASASARSPRTFGPSAQARNGAPSSSPRGFPEATAQAIISCSLASVLRSSSFV
mmetsp:Transcript_8075/g.22729  ORF Transcript_8075/g.22729 Transcript_8075/m.22729 type:complete len:212 (-) Transcript_8075:370-1005(-)